LRHKNAKQKTKDMKVIVQRFKSEFKEYYTPLSKERAKAIEEMLSCGCGGPAGHVPGGVWCRK
jgi:hypothetical protein